MYSLHYHTWPGGERELINRIRRVLVMCEEHFITPADLGLERRSPNRRVITLIEARAQAEKEVIFRSLRQTKGNVSLAAIQPDISRPTLYRLMKKHHISI